MVDTPDDDMPLTKGDLKSALGQIVPQIIREVREIVRVEVREIVRDELARAFAQETYHIIPERAWPPKQ